MGGDCRFEQVRAERRRDELPSVENKHFSRDVLETFRSNQSYTAANGNLLHGTWARVADGLALRKTVS